jgi:hypothetical protein
MNIKKIVDTIIDNGLISEMINSNSLKFIENNANDIDNDLSNDVNDDIDKDNDIDVNDDIDNDIDANDDIDNDIDIDNDANDIDLDNDNDKDNDGDIEYTDWMRVAAFDVAVKTLSFCILEYKIPVNMKKETKNKNNLKYRCIKWEIINLIENPKCEYLIRYINKNNVACGDPAKFLTEDEDLINKFGKHLCQKHKNDIKSFKKRIDKVDVEFKSLINNTVKKTSPFDICKNLIQKLDKYPELLNVNEIIIESQPSNKNPIMKSISSEIFSYFMIRAVVDKPDKNIKVSYVHATSNLSTAGDITFESTIENCKKEYTLKKKQSVEYCLHLLKQSNFNNGNHLEWIKLFNNNTKKDDLADSFTHAYSYILRKNKFSFTKKVNRKTKKENKV